MTTCLTMDGGLGLRTVDAAREKILAALEGGSVELILPDGAPVDLCGVQLIEAARMHALALGRSITLGHPGEALRPLLEAAGFLTDASPDALQFWFHQGVVQ